MNRRVEAEILGKKYSFVTDKSEEEFERIITFLKARLEDARAFGGDVPREILVLALLNVCELYIDLKTEHEKLIDNIKMMEKKIDSHL